ncbi:MAG: VanZ family protein [Gammaproteobacteria bacterium]|nr:VanZ family protein [Gammaproteobacteria bacterium]
MSTPAINSSRRGLLALGTVVIAALGLMLFADLNGQRIQDISLLYPGSDKLAHFITHIGLVGLLYWVLRRAWSSLGRTATLTLAALASVLLGLVDESQQYFMSNREFDLLDVTANLCGTATVTLLIAALTSKRRLAWLMLLPLGVFITVLAHTYTSGYLYGQGLLHIRHYEYAAARQSFLQAIERGHGRAALYNELAWIELEFLDTDPAASLRYTTLAIQEKPNKADYLDTHGWALHRNGRHQEGLEFLLKAYARAPNTYCIHYHLGAVYHVLGQDTLAIEHLKQQITLKAEGRFADKSQAILKQIEAATQRNR